MLFYNSACAVVNKLRAKCDSIMKAKYKKTLSFFIKNFTRYNKNCNLKKFLNNYLKLDNVVLKGKCNGICENTCNRYKKFIRR